MTTLVLEPHSELAKWLEAVAEKRGLSLQDAASQLLDESRMQYLSMRQITVPARDGQCWIARTPMRGLIYQGYEIEWTLAPSRTAKE